MTMKGHARQLGRIPLPPTQTETSSAHGAKPTAAATRPSRCGANRQSPMGKPREATRLHHQDQQPLDPTHPPGRTVTYRVVQVSDNQLDGQSDGSGAVSVVSSTAFTGGQQAVAQAVIQNPFSNGGSPSTDSVGGETRFAYFPASAVGEATTAVVSAQADPSLAQGGGQFYVMMTPQDVLQTGTQRTIAPRTHPYSPKEDPDLSNMKIDGPRTPRDERRRAQHNEVERRRRDKINNWIVQLSKIIPDCNADNTKTGQSKGGILSKACDYIRELRQTNQRMQESFKDTERLQLDNELLRQQIDELKNENALLRAQLQQRGIELVGEVPGQ
ncbi:upstream stimulatory factor 2-like [Carcharodon carcharias]|uniref:upstream stimulatory factor 2-like n=1 Tax=Carcharodon carcharias TaxID=13397 RepID=UPI001B7F69CC|nr:upstream stimulatory factor 2-like [Carcharodon carcharias]